MYYIVKDSSSWATWAYIIPLAVGESVPAEGFGPYEVREEAEEDLREQDFEPIGEGWLYQW